MSRIDDADDLVQEEEGVPPDLLSEDDLLRELGQIHRTRHETFLHAPTPALQHHSERTVALEMEYLRRHPERDVVERSPGDDTELTCDQVG